MKRADPHFKVKNMLAILIGLALSSSVFATKMDLETHNLVIEKLESTLKVIGKGDQNINGLSLKYQLANLYAEKARLLVVEEGHQNCQSCLGSKSFRLKAVTIYQQILPQLKGDDNEQVHLQLAHLYETLDRNKEALALYERLISNTQTSGKVKAVAYSKRGASYFQEGQFPKAIKDFSLAQRLSPREQQGQSIHKIAWAYYNMGEIDVAIGKLVSILESEELLQQPSDQGMQYSESFHIEVAHDLALFMAKDNVNQSSLQRLISLSPQSEAINNLLFLGDEAERVGQLSSAPLAWELALSMDNFPVDRKLPVLLGVARFHADNFRFEKAHHYFTKALEHGRSTYGESFGTDSCKERCLENARAAKQFLVQWEKRTSKMTKSDLVKTSQAALIKSYVIYHQFQNKDYETHLWLGQLAQKLKLNELARRSFSEGADLIVQSKDIRSEKFKNLLNATLLTEVDLAESGSSAKIKLQAYEHYLSLITGGQDYQKIQYQKARLYYDLNDSKKAFELFDQLVSDARFTNKELKIKAANLSLDSLVISKDIETLEQKSIDYSKMVPSEAVQFHKISRKAGLQIARGLVKKDNSASGAAKALDKLNSVTLTGADQDEVKSILRLKIDLALKAKNWTNAQSTLSQFSRRSDLNRDEKTWSLAKKLALAELLLDFKAAYQTVLQLNYHKSIVPEELLKGALLAELSGEDPGPWLKKVINSRKSSKRQTNLARAQLVRLSVNPWSSLHAQQPYLKTAPTLFADLALECFAKDGNISQAHWALTGAGVKSTWSGQTLQRFLTLKDLNLAAEQLSHQRLNSRTDALLGSSLRNRVQTLDFFEKTLRQSRRAQDWSLQVIAAAVLKKEYLRLAAETELLPIPKKLSEKEKQSYQKELFAQAANFRKTSQEDEQFLASKWRDKSYVDFLIEKIESNEKLRSILMSELRSLAAHAPTDLVREIQEKLNTLKDRPSRSALAEAHLQLRKDPFDTALQEQLLSMERQLGHQSMVVFLQARGGSIKEGQL